MKTNYRNNTWLQINVYPSTRSGEFKAVVFRNVGYHWHCEQHEKKPCKKCKNFVAHEVLGIFATYPMDSIAVGDIVEELGRLLTRDKMGKGFKQVYLGPMQG